MVADGEQVEVSDELLLLANINKYGVEAVMGRPLYHHEILAMNTAERIVRAYNGRFASGDWAKWAQENKGESALLNEAMQIARAYGWR